MVKAINRDYLYNSLHIATKLPVPQQDTGSFHINMDKFLILIRLNFLHENHQIQILINVNIPVAAVK